MISRQVKAVVVVLIYMIAYFTLFLPFSDTIISFTNSFIQANAGIFRFNTTKITYTFDNSTGQIVSNTTVETIDYSPLISFITYLIFYFVLPIVIPILMLFRLRG